MAQITQTNAAKLHYFAEKDRLFEVKAVLGFGGLSAIICEICGRHWGFVCVDCLSTLACYFPADSADLAEEYSKLYYLAEKDRLFEVKDVLLFVVCCLLFVVCYLLFVVCLRNLRDLRETLGFRLCGLLEYSYVFILPQMAQITQTNTAKLYYFAEK